MTAEVVLAQARTLLDGGDGRGAVDLVVAANRPDPRPVLEEALVRLRHEAAASLDAGRPGARTSVPLDPFDQAGIPEVPKEALTAELLAAGLAHRGALLVRGFLSTEASADLLGSLRQAFASAEAFAAGAPAEQTTPWYVPFDPQDGFSFGAIERGFAQALGGVLSVESPRTLSKVIEAFGAARVGELLEAYFGEWPVLSAKKSTLRRATPTSPTEWHQDGAFLGAETRTVNAWVALTPCGTHAPGIEIFPHAFDHIVETGTEDARFSWSVSPSHAERMGVPAPQRPEFGPGDALLFNQMTLHRTGITPAMTEDRYAIESWFFAPSTYPYEQVPVLF